VEVRQDINWVARSFPLPSRAAQLSAARSVPRVELIAKMQLMAQRGELEFAGGCVHGDRLKHELVTSNSPARDQQDDLARWPWRSCVEKAKIS